MQSVVRLLTGYKNVRSHFYRRRYTLGSLQKVGLACGMAVVTGIAAQIRIPLSYTPVPITGQVFAVLFSGVLLGRWYGGLSQLFYVGIGAFGLPWFAGLSGGVSVLAGPTGGYLLGFILASGVTGWFTDSYVSMRRFFPLLGINVVAIALIYLCGAFQLSIVLGSGVQRTIQYGVMPFIGVDLIKAVLVAIAAWGMTPKQAYNGELDA